MIGGGVGVRVGGWGGGGCEIVKQKDNHVSFTIMMSWSKMMRIT